MPGGLVTLGEALVTIGSVEPGPWAVGSGLRASFAGAEANVAIGLARLGHPACWMGRLGQDPAGNLVLRGLRAEAVDVSRVRRDADAPTAVLLREQRTSDQAGIRYFRSGSAGSRLASDDIDAEVVVGAGLVHVTGITAGLGVGPLAAVRRLVDLARQAGVPVSFDVNYRAALWSEADAAEVLAPLARQADLVFGGPEELALLSRSGAVDPAEVAAELLDAGVREVVLKDGSRGATSYSAPSAELVEGSGGSDPQSWSVAAFPVTVVDPVGAGDAFVAGYLSGVLAGLDPLEKLDRGARLGAIAVSTRGDWEGLPLLAELDTLLAGQDVTR
jgi:2-dehydro-3-deoxygluconokinase